MNGDAQDRVDAQEEIAAQKAMVVELASKLSEMGHPGIAEKMLSDLEEKGFDYVAQTFSDDLSRVVDKVGQDLHDFLDDPQGKKRKWR